MKPVTLLVIALATLLASGVRATDNQLTKKEKREGWKLLFDGKTTMGWRDSKNNLLPDSQVQEECLNPHPSNYMLIHERVFDNFKLALDFKISPKCNSGIFIRTFPLTPRPGKDVGFNGIEIAIDDTTDSSYHDTGAFYDLTKPTKNAMKPVGEWNHIVITCNLNLLEVELNGEKVNSLDLEEWTSKNRRPDGTDHKFDVAYKDHPRKGYIGLQDHGSDCWYKNIKILPLKRSTRRASASQMPSPSPQLK